MRNLLRYCMRLNTYFLPLFGNMIILWVIWGCSMENSSEAASEYHLTRVKAQPYQVPADSVLPPTRVDVKILSIPKEKIAIPKKVFSKFNVLPTQNPQRITINPAALVKNEPGKGAFSKPGHSPALEQHIAVGIPEVVQAKDPSNKDQNPFSFSAFGKLQGLKHNVISCIIQDSKENLWFGSMGGGLCRYDGKYFTHYTENEGLSSNSITCILEDKTGNIWLGTDGAGIIKFDGHTFVQYYQEEGFEGSYISDLKLDKQDKLWIATTTNGVFQFDGKSFTHYGAEQGLGSDEVLSMMIDRKGQIWFGLLDAGISVFNKGQFIRFNQQAGLSYGDITALAEDKNGHIWVGTQSGPLRYDDGVFFDYSNSAKVPIEDIIIETSGNVWFGTLRNGAIKYDGASFQFYTVSEGLNNNRVRCIFEDSSGGLWFGTDGGGLSKSQGNVFSHLTTQEGLSNNEIFSIIEDRKGQMWFGASGGGLVRFVANQFYQYTEPSELNPDFIYAILEDRKGNLWFGTNGQGVIKFDGQFLSRINDQNGLSSNIVLSILEDKKGNIWFGTRDGGVCKFDGQSLVQYQEAQGLGSNTVFSMLEDPQGNIWFCTLSGGVSKFDGHNFFHYRTEHGLSHNDVTSVLRDKKGQFWFGTLGGGINRFDGQYFTHFTEAEGLSNNAVLALLQDRNGHLWIGTRFGLSKMDNKTLNALNKQTASYTFSASSILFKNYSYEDGFLGIGCWRNSIYEALNGDIYIGANDRLTVYHPGGAKENATKTQLSLLDISIYNERIPWASLEEHRDSSFYLGNGVKVRDFRFKGLSAWNLVPQDLSLTYSNNNLNFRLVASTLQHPDKVKYQYKLEGMEATWTSLSPKNEVSYANLAPGTYTLRARARNSVGLWSNELAYSFVIRPPWWRTSWMYTFYALVVLGILWWFRRQEKLRQQQQLQLERQKTEQEQQINEQLRRVDALKDQFLANTSHELRTPLQGIIGLSESLLERVNDDDQKEDLNMVISSSRRLNSLVNDILDFSKIKNQEIELTVAPLNLYALTDVLLRSLAPLTQGKNLQLINAIPKDLPSVLADENRVQQILYNLVGNAIKFTEKGHIKIFAKVPPDRPDEIILSVEDTGIGVPIDKRDSIFHAFEQGDGSMVRNFAGTGLGLSISKKLVELHEGQMWLESEVGQGSTFFLSLPLTMEQASQKAAPSVDQKLSNLTQFSWNQSALQVPPRTVLSKEEIEKVHILVVDDEAVNQQVLKNYLNKAVYRLTQVMSGEEALSFLEQDDTPDLVLLDVMMPRMSGYEVCQKIREKYLPNELPVIMITAKNQVHDLILGLNTGANDYIAKPFSKDEFLARLNTHLNLHRINAATNRFVPNEFIRALGHESIMNVRLGDHVEQVVTVLFADIRDYTSLAEAMTPEENFKFVSAYNQRIGPIIQKHQGFINQYLGDGIMAIFPGKPENALRASIELQHELSQYNLNRQAKGRKPIEVGIGLHTGSLIMGIIGDQKRMDAATVSDTVNTASRMEGLTKFYGSRILLSEACLNLIQQPEEFHVRYLGQVQVKGKQAPIGIFECFDADEPTLFLSKKENLLRFEQGLNHYFQKSFEEAIKSFEAIVALNPSDIQSKLFLTKARDFARNGVAEDWIGVETMKEK
ncbi:MAG: two-component regulator propeller domain-containing protein [Haliscomenobacter sp.]|uniref:two-component regulator propeller domain-containing protein n=1 Tax=Haliscomenobacter sp. TaxID=2717303 RepID=UPI0029A89EEC|nr:two-component regulator propeller domain-containing protein [Haliscomenobacter sp.]MDX2069588.1 two-component regulator propeller domain-containing protein [Haliscomenobacter sp.]